MFLSVAYLDGFSSLIGFVSIQGWRSDICLSSFFNKGIKQSIKQAQAKHYSQ